MKVYDKAVWHIDGGEKPSEVVKRFRIVFEFLNTKKLLNDEGMETLEYAMDSSVSLNSSMVNAEGKRFLDKNYSHISRSATRELLPELEKAFSSK